MLILTKLVNVSLVSYWSPPAAAAAAAATATTTTTTTSVCSGRLSDVDALISTAPIRRKTCNLAGVGCRWIVKIRPDLAATFHTF